MIESQFVFFDKKNNDEFDRQKQKNELLLHLKNTRICMGTLTTGCLTTPNFLSSCVLLSFQESLCVSHDHEEDIESTPNLRH